MRTVLYQGNPDLITPFAQRLHGLRQAKVMGGKDDFYAIKWLLLQPVKLWAAQGIDGVKNGFGVQGNDRGNHGGAMISRHQHFVAGLKAK